MLLIVNYNSVKGEVYVQWYPATVTTLNPDDDTYCLPVSTGFEVSKEEGGDIDYEVDLEERKATLYQGEIEEQSFTFEFEVVEAVLYINS